MSVLTYPIRGPGAARYRRLDFELRALVPRGPALPDAKSVSAWQGVAMRLTHFAFAAAIFVATGSITPRIQAELMAPTNDIGEKVPGAERLEGRLLAPCCWAQTLDIHGSEIANSLRREIRARLKAGENPEAIERSLVARYGERIRAVPDRVPLDRMGEFGWVGVAVAAGFLAYVLLQWRKRGTSSYIETDPRGPNFGPSERKSDEASDERLEAELHRINDT